MLAVGKLAGKGGNAGTPAEDADELELAPVEAVDEGDGTAAGGRSGCARLSGFGNGRSIGATGWRSAKDGSAGVGTVQATGKPRGNSARFTTRTCRGFVVVCP